VTLELERPCTSPAISGTTAVFQYFNQRARNVQMMADCTDWQPVPMEREDGSWFLEVEFPPDARTEYLFVVNGQGVLDPLNPYSGPGGFGPRSECRMPEYVPPHDFAPPADGHLEDVTLAGRNVRVYVPERVEDAAVLAVQDGEDYISFAGMPGAIDALIHAGQIPPTLAVFVNPVDREREYRPNDAYVSWLADELLPDIYGRYEVDHDPGRHGLVGASLGGLIATAGALRRPDAFRLVGAQSPAYRPNASGLSLDELLLGRLEVSRGSMRFHVDGGTFESIFHRQPYLQHIRTGARLLEDAGSPVQYVETNEGHNWNSWRARLPAMFTWLLA
jgi:enterochelin esterase-like enzyme